MKSTLYPEEKHGGRCSDWTPDLFVRLVSMIALVLISTFSGARLFPSKCEKLNWPQPLQGLNENSQLKLSLLQEGVLFCLCRGTYKIYCSMQTANADLVTTLTLRKRINSPNSGSIGNDYLHNSANVRTTCLLNMNV